MTKRYTNEEKKLCTKKLVSYFILFLLLYVFVVLYDLGIIFDDLQIFNLSYDIDSKTFSFVAIGYLVAFLIFLFYILFIPKKVNKIFKGKKMGFVVKILKYCCLFIPVLLWLFSVVIYFLDFGENVNTVVTCLFLSTTGFLVSFELFLEIVSETGGTSNVDALKYKIKHKNYYEFKQYLSAKLNIDVNNFKSFEEENCVLEYYDYTKENDDYIFALIHLNKINRDVLGDYLDEGFINFFEYRYKDVDVSKKNFYAYFIFIVDEMNDVFKELITSCTPMQDNYYFLGIGLDVNSKELFITVYDKKKYRKEYNLLVKDFESIIEDIKIK